MFTCAHVTNLQNNWINRILHFTSKNLKKKPIIFIFKKKKMKAYFNEVRQENKKKKTFRQKIHFSFWKKKNEHYFSGLYLVTGENIFKHLKMTFYSNKMLNFKKFHLEAGTKLDSNLLFFFRIQIVCYYKKVFFFCSNRQW